MNTLIHIEHLTLAYDSNVIIHDLSLEIENEDYICIVGENGAGKSTLVKGLLGLLRVASGKISLLNGLTMNEIGYLPQMTAAQKNFPASSHEVILSGCLNGMKEMPFYTKENKKKAQVAMEKLSIENLKNHCFAELSGGQQRRVLLARALCSTKKALILDEPTAGLDPKATNELYKVIEMLNKEERITIVMVSHDIANATRYAKHILHLTGENSFFGTIVDYRKSILGSYFAGGDLK